MVPRVRSTESTFMSLSATNTLSECQVLLLCPGQNLLPKEVQMQKSICANNIEFIFSVEFILLYEKHLFLLDRKTMIKSTSSCFSLNDHSGFKLETAEINKQKKHSILEKIGMKGKLHHKCYGTDTGFRPVQLQVHSLFSIIHCLFSVSLAKLRVGFRSLILVSPYHQCPNNSNTIQRVHSNKYINFFKSSLSPWIYSIMIVLLKQVYNLCLGSNSFQRQVLKTTVTLV